MNRRTIRVQDDHGRTQHNWRALDSLAGEDLAGFHIMDGVTGNPPTGRPRLPDALLTPEGKRKREYRDHRKATLTPFEGRSSTPQDWRREDAERAAATARVEAWKAQRDKRTR